MTDDTSPGSIAGGVFDDATGAALAGATVLFHVEGQDTPTQTDGQGRFGFPQVYPGQYLLRASLDGYRPNSQPVLVAPGTQTPVEFRLGPIPHG